MTLDELIEELTLLRDEENVPGDTEVRGAYQPSYPLYGEIDTVTYITATKELYLGVDGNGGYAPPNAFDGGVVEPDNEDGE